MEPDNAKIKNLDGIRLNPSDDYQLHVFLMKIAKQITDEEFNEIKFYCSGKNGMAKGILEKIEDCISLFRHMKELNMLSNENLATFQAMIWHLGRKDLYRQFVEFCKNREDILHFFASSDKPANGYIHVDFHIRGTKDFRLQDLEELRNSLSNLLCCPPGHIIIDGIEPTSSIHITFMIPEFCIEHLLTITEADKGRLYACGVDRFKVEEQLVDCIDFKENEHIPSLDKDVAVTKLLQTKKQLEKDLERYQIAYEDQVSYHTEYLGELENAKERSEELHADIRKLKNMIREYQLSCLQLSNDLEKTRKAILTDDDQEIEVYSRKSGGITVLRRTISQANKAELEKKSNFFQWQIIKALQTSRACEITSDIMRTVQKNRKDIDVLKDHIHRLVNSEIFDEVYAAVLNLISIEDAIAEKEGSDYNQLSTYYIDTDDDDDSSDSD
ncbi:uncharacterized protein LOC143078942 [Mytilus galloprovincialis]|uniref:uncharacterized protein LOC143078942 n=1 Tax=Mytilus galloprovincialis TaxID=29158 RepID=UPI003F7B9D10